MGAGHLRRRPAPAAARVAEGPQGPRARLGSPRPGLGAGLGRAGPGWAGRASPQRLPLSLDRGERRRSGRSPARAGPRLRRPLSPRVTPGVFYTSFRLLDFGFFLRHGGWTGGWSRCLSLGGGSGRQRGPSERHWRGSPGPPAAAVPRQPGLQVPGLGSLARSGSPGGERSAGCPT